MVLLIVKVVRDFSNLIDFFLLLSFSFAHTFREYRVGEVDVIEAVFRVGFINRVWFIDEFALIGS